MSGMDRRAFFKIVATSGAAVAAAGCGQDANELIGRLPEKLIPYVVPPEGIVPGVAAYFSTVCRECPAGCGLVAKNRDGRIIKLEGNPDHPVNAGALCIRGQAALQGLYHPDRYRGPLKGGKAIAWDEAEKLLADQLGALVKGRQGNRIAVVSGLETGSLGRLMDEWTKALGARPRVAYEPLGYEALRAANRATFGRDAHVATSPFSFPRVSASAAASASASSAGWPSCPSCQRKSCRKSSRLSSSTMSFARTAGSRSMPRRAAVPRRSMKVFRNLLTCRGLPRSPRASTGAIRFANAKSESSSGGGLSSMPTAMP